MGHVSNSNEETLGNTRKHTERNGFKKILFSECFRVLVYYLPKISPFSFQIIYSSQNYGFAVDLTPNLAEKPEKSFPSKIGMGRNTLSALIPPAPFSRRPH